MDQFEIKLSKQAIRNRMATALSLQPNWAKKIIDSNISALFANRGRENSNSFSHHALISSILVIERE